MLKETSLVSFFINKVFDKGGNVLVYTAYYESPIGIVEIKATEQKLVSVSFVEKSEIEQNKKEENSIIIQTIAQLTEYFKGKRKEFVLPMDVQGTEFQKKVLNQVEKIPYGMTNSYREIALSINKEKASRAVGNANNKNKLLIVIPCHRVIGTNGKLVGYAGGIWRKEWLLNLEKRMSGND